MSTVDWRLVDMHCHLDRMSNAEEVAREAAGRGIALFDTTVTPADACAAQDLLGSFDNVRVGTGLHPWWLADGRCGASDAARATELAGKSPFVGEVGLDFGRRGDGAQKLQTAAFEDICGAIAHHPLPHRVISIHAIRAVSTALDILERTGILGEDARRDTAVIFHWFSGTSDELARASSSEVPLNQWKITAVSRRASSPRIPVRSKISSAVETARMAWMEMTRWGSGWCAMAPQMSSKAAV